MPRIFTSDCVARSSLFCVRPRNVTSFLKRDSTSAVVKHALLPQIYTTSRAFRIGVEKIKDQPLNRILAAMRLIWITAIGLLIGLPRPHGQAQAPEVPLRVSLCEVKLHPEKYLRAFVELTAVASHGFEDSMVEDAHCPWPKSGPGVWMEYGGNRSTDTMYCCGFSPKPTRDKPLVVDSIPLSLIEDENFRLFDARLHPKHTKPQRGSDTVQAILRGRIFAKYEGIAGTQLNPAWRGYGHMRCCMLFVVTQVISVDSPK